MYDLSAKEISDHLLADKKRKLPASRSAFATGLTIVLGTLYWFDVLGLAAIVLICFMYLVYLVSETADFFFDQLFWLRYEAAMARQRAELLEERRQNAREKNAVRHISDDVAP